MLRGVYGILYRFLASLARLAVRSGRSKELEIIVLRHQLAVLRRQAARPALNDDDRSLLALSPKHSPGHAATDGSSHPTPSCAGTADASHDTGPNHPTGLVDRPPTPRSGASSSTWRPRTRPGGYRRIHGELTGLGHTAGASTVWRILKHHGIDPAPQRSTVTWTQFLRSQAAVACDFATIDTAPLGRYYLLFFIDITNREVFFAGITVNPTGPWTTQAARNLFLRNPDRFADARALVRDHGSQFIDAFDEIFQTEGLKVLKTPIRTPVANTFAERWIGTLRRELLDRTIIWNQRQLQRLVTDYIDHYTNHRPHRSLEQRPPHRNQRQVSAVRDTAQLRVVRSARCVGLINEYNNAA